MENPPGPGDAHGCPFKHFSWDNLSASIQSLGINESKQIREIEDAVRNKHYHVACTKVWEFTHPNAKGGLLESINHPNMYFEKSYKLANSDQEALATSTTVM